MKRIFGLLAICITTFSSFGQFSVSKLNGTPINNGDVFTFNGTSAAVAEFKFKVTNTSQEDNVNIKIKVMDIVNASGSDFQLCFGDLCFFSITEGNSYPPNFPLTLEPGQSNGNFDHFWNTNTGDGQTYPIDYVLKFYQVTDNGVEFGDSVTITYRYQPQLSVSDFEQIKNMGVTLNGTVLNNQMNFESSSEGTVTLTDMNGKTLLQSKFAPGYNSIDISHLSASIYFLNVSSSEKSATIKVLKK